MLPPSAHAELPPVPAPLLPPAPAAPPPPPLPVLVVLLLHPISVASAITKSLSVTSTGYVRSHASGKDGPFAGTPRRKHMLARLGGSDQLGCSVGRIKMSWTCTCGGAESR